MLTSLPLRLRIFLFFLFLCFAGIGAVLGGLFIGHQRANGGNLQNGFVLAGVIASFGLLGLCAGVWLLFDENVAKPIERMAAALRTQAHAGVNAPIDAEAARFLGDLAPAAQAVTGQLSQTTLDAASAVAAETARLAAEKERLTELLTDIPIAMVLVSPHHQITLYDGQAAQILSQVHVPRLNASIFDYFAEADIRSGYEEMLSRGEEVSFSARGAEGALEFALRLKPLSQAPGYMLLIDETHALLSPGAARPLVYDFTLTDQPAPERFEDTPLDALTFTVFDSETTGLNPVKDEVVQLGAVRVVNGKIIASESLDLLVNPGRPIPPASTKVHMISDEMVKDAPDIREASRQFHMFAKGSVIVAHNAPFDMAFLKRHAAHAGVTWDHPILDTVLLSAVLFGASETHTLDALSARLGVSIPSHLRHTAMGDAVATAQVLCHLLPMLKSRGYESFGAVVEQTRKHGRLLQDLN